MKNRLIQNGSPLLLFLRRPPNELFAEEGEKEGGEHYSIIMGRLITQTKEKEEEEGFTGRTNSGIYQLCTYLLQSIETGECFFLLGDFLLFGRLSIRKRR